MEEITTNKNLKEKRQNERYNNESSSPIRLGRSYDNTLNRNFKDQNFTSYNITSENKDHQIN